MDKSGIVFGHHSPEKREMARRLRREMTPAECLLWNHLRTDRLGGFHFRRQQVVDGFIVDFYCHAAGLIIEIDGPVHLRTVERDRERERVFEARGLRVIRFTNGQVLHHLEQVLSEVLRALQSAPL